MTKAWNEIKKEYFKDVLVCECYCGCGKPPTEAHHTFIQARKSFRKYTDVIENMSAVCTDCHVKHAHSYKFRKHRADDMWCIGLIVVGAWLNTLPSKLDSVKEEALRLFDYE